MRIDSIRGSVRTVIAPRVDTPAWRALRNSSIGGSDIGVLAGLSPWKKRAEWVAERRLGGPPELDGDALVRGRCLESGILDWAAERWGYVDRQTGQQLLAPPWAHYTPDATAVLDGRRVLLEVKTTARRGDNWGRAGTGVVPAQYAAQVQWGMMLTGLSEAHILVLSGGRSSPQLDLSRYILHSDHDEQERLFNIAASVAIELGWECKQ